ncbi:hypothetical protein BTVI_119499 [Pitangus sulphuratus]|nr:hypothetical protein BTVI_119499 [Pitangus sulphuratus]
MSPVSSGTRSPSPLGQQTPPAAPKSLEQVCQQRDIPAENVGPALKFQKGENGVTPGVKYITEPLIKALSKQQNLACISSLNLSSPKDGDKKFKFIENLEKCSQLETLNLSNNQIEKMEKLDKLLKLRELNLACNRISKIEGLEHLQNLQKLNLAGNEIEHIPVWVGKKLRSLRVLNLTHNKLSSLHDIAKLKPLQDLTSLFLADNPVGNLPHCCLYTIFHLRALENLDGQPVTNHDRQEALERFNLEEIEKLEKELENTVKEMENLKLTQSKVLEQLHHQDEVNKSLKEKTLQQKQSFEDLQRDLGTKNELLKQKTVELTRACQKQYELEQELAFYKIDAKFEPLNYFPSEEVEVADVPGESPYIGKARYKRNMFVREGYLGARAQQLHLGQVQRAGDEFWRKTQLELHLQTLDGLLERKEKKINSAQRRLEELQSAIADAEQRVWKVTKELQQLEAALDQKKISQANRAATEQQLSEKIQLLQELQRETLDLEKQIEKQRREIGKKQKELEDLQSSLASVNPEDPRHAHMKAQTAGKEQQVDMMTKQCQQLESRLDEMLARIAKETEEIKDLEQQLTDGQIATNEALKRDLESIITGLQEYLQSVKCQARQANEECKKLQKDKESLLERLADLEEDKNNLEMVAMDAEKMRKEIAVLESALQEQQEVNDSLREAQGRVSAYEAELEAQLRDRDAEAKQQKEEFERLKQLSQGDNNLLKEQLKDLQKQLNHAVGNLIHPEEVLACIDELRQMLQSGAGEMKCPNSADVVGKSLADLQRELRDILADAEREKEKAWAKQRQLQEEMVSQQEKLEELQEKYRQASIKQLKQECFSLVQKNVKAENRQNKNKVHQLENEIQHLHEKLKSMEEIQGLADQQLQEADEEKEAILAQLEDLEKRKKIEDARAQLQVVSLDKELQELQRAIVTSDKLAATELSLAKNQLRALRGTVLRINQERAEELQEAEEFCAEAARAAQDLARAEAEIELLQQLLKEKEEQESQVSRLEDTVCYLRSRKHRDCCWGAAEHKHKREVEKLLQNVEELEHDRAELQGEVAELRRAAQRQSRRRDFIDGYTDTLMAELQLERSLRHQQDVAEEVGCVEKTLLKRRAELREADRLLSEAQVELESTRGKTKEALQKYSRAKQHLSCTEAEAKELEQRAQGMATELGKAAQQLRLLQADTRDLEQQKREQEGILKEINKVVAVRDSEFQSLNQKIEMLSESLQKLQGDVRLAEGNEDHHLQIIREAESLVQGKKTELETLKDQIGAQQQELLFLEQQVKQRTEELHVLQDCIALRKGDLKEALRDGEAEAHEKLRQIREIKAILEELNAERKELDAQLSEKRAQLAFLSKDIRQEEENLQGILGQITKHKMELKHVLEMLELEKNELEGLKVQHEQKLSELEKTQVAALEEKLKLENMQRLFQCQQGEVEWQEQLLQKDRQENEQLVSQMRSLQSDLEALAKEKEKLEEESWSLEKRLSHTRRDLTAAEESSRTALSNAEKMELKVKNLQQEVELLSKQKKSLSGEIVAVQEDLQGKKEELETVKGELRGSREQLQAVEQDLENSTRQQEELLREQAALRGAIQECLRKRKEQQERQKKRENRLQQLQKKIEEKETELARQEEALHHLKQSSEREGKKLEECTAKGKDEKILLEKELAEQHQKLEQTVAKVRLAEENLWKLEKEESRCAALEETVRKSKQQLLERESQLQQKHREMQSLQEELQVSRSELKQLQDQMMAERREAEKQILSLKETQKMQRMELERKLQDQRQENTCLQSDVAVAEQVALRNRQRAKGLGKDLGQIQQHCRDLQTQVKTLEERQREMESAATLLNLEVEDEIRTGFKSANSSSLYPLEDLETSWEGKGSPWCDSGASEPFTAAEGQLLSLGDKWNISSIFLMAQLWQSLAQQAEVLLQGKQQTAGSLHSLQRQLDELHELLSSSTSDSLLLAKSSSLASLHSTLNSTRTQTLITQTFLLFPDLSARPCRGPQQAGKRLGVSHDTILLPGNLSVKPEVRHDISLAPASLRAWNAMGHSWGFPDH